MLSSDCPSECHHGLSRNNNTIFCPYYSLYWIVYYYWSWFVLSPVVHQFVVAKSNGNFSFSQLIDILFLKADNYPSFPGMWSHAFHISWRWGKFGKLMRIWYPNKTIEIHRRTAASYHFHSRLQENEYYKRKAFSTDWIDSLTGGIN